MMYDITQVLLQEYASASFCKCTVSSQTITSGVVTSVNY